MIKCACGDEKCQTKIIINVEDSMMLIESEKPTVGVYLDGRTAQSVIDELNDFLRRLEVSKSEATEKSIGDMTLSELKEYPKSVEE